MRRSKRNWQRPPEPPKNAVEGAAWVRRYLIDLYDHRDGEAANWQLIAETAFKVAFDALDVSPASERQAAMLIRLHAASYERLADPTADRTGKEGSDAGSHPTLVYRLAGMEREAAGRDHLPL